MPTILDRIVEVKLREIEESLAGPAESQTGLF